MVMSLDHYSDDDITTLLESWLATKAHTEKFIESLKAEKQRRLEAEIGRLKLELAVERITDCPILPEPMIFDFETHSIGE